VTAIRAAMTALGIGRPGETNPRHPHDRYLFRSLHLTPWSKRMRFGWALGWDGPYWHNAVGIAGPDWDGGDWLGGMSWHKHGPFVVCRSVTRIPADYREFVRVSVDLPANPKLAMIDNPAAGWAYVVSLCYCGQHRTTCAPLAAVLETAGVRRGVARKLIGGGLWHEHGHGCGQCRQPPAGSVAVHNDDLFVPCPARNWRPSIPEALRQAVYDRDGHVCLDCGTTDDLSLDHVFPYSLGGEDTFENFQTLCMPCNIRKGVRV
jgi:hypothetical protein